MGISNYTELKAEILAFLERDGDATVTDRLDTIIPLAESWINRRLAGYQRELSAPIVTDGNGIGTLPAGFVGARTLRRADGRTFSYDVSGSTITVTAGASQSLNLLYLSRLVGLSDANPTNWLLDASPDAYLDACLMRASILLQDPAGAAAYEGSAAAAIDDLTIQNQAAQYANQRFAIPVRVP